MTVTEMWSVNEVIHCGINRLLSPTRCCGTQQDYEMCIKKKKTLHHSKLQQQHKQSTQKMITSLPTADRREETRGTTRFGESIL